jgi:hypothetical protein
VLYQYLNQVWSHFASGCNDVRCFLPSRPFKRSAFVWSTVSKSKKPHKSLCGLGSWREQQQTIEIHQKFACRLTRPHKNLRGSLWISFV